MTTITAGNVGSYTLPTRSTISISPDANEVCTISVTRSGAQVYGEQVTEQKTIGPFNAGDVFTITANLGNADYTAAPYVESPAPGIITSYTAAQLTALAAAGWLTPWAGYVASDTGDEYTATSPSTLSARTSRRGKTLAFFGTSITMSGRQVALFGYNPSTANGFGSTNWAILWVDPETPSGAGNWTYNSTTKLSTWAAFGESAGTAVDVSKSGIYYLPSSVAGHGITVVLDAGTSYSTGTTVVTVPADGNQWQAVWAPRGYAPCVMAQLGPSWTLAPAPVYRYGFAMGGTPGMAASTLAGATWQTNQIYADVDIIETGTNDVGSRTAAQIIADLTTIIQARRSVGTRNIGVLTIPPRDSGWSAANLKTRNQVNRWIRDYCASIKGLRCIDIAAAVTNPATGIWVSGYSSDGVHPTPLGAWAMARLISTWLASIESDTPYYPDYNDLYDATYNPYGALQAAAGYTGFVGTGGTAGGGVTGVVPANYTVGRAAGTITAVGSQPARTDGIAGNWYQLVITGGGANEYLNIQPQSNPLTLSTYGVAAGDSIEGFIEVNIASSSGLKLVNMILTFGGLSGRSIEAQNDILGGNLPLTDSPGKFWLRLPPTTIPVGATTMSITFRVGADTSATVQFGRWSVNKARPL